MLVEGRLPYSWLTYDPVAGQTVDPARVKLLPEPVQVDVTGREAGPGEGTYAAYVPSPFRFCLRCRTSYEQARGNDFAKLAKLSAEGRSSAMSLITASIVRTLRTWEGDLDDKARKLLAFVDNRQDASLQAGHFNDFVQVTQLRGALYRALDKAPEGLTDEIVAQRVTEELGLAMADFARNPGAKYSQRDEAWRALREVTGYRLYLDLERGWRVTMPNLEQTGLLRIRYRDLPEVAADAEAWRDSHVALRDDDPVHREEIAAALLDELRRNLAIDVEYLSDDGFDLVRRLSAQHLKEPWSLPERELPPMAGVAFPGPGKRGQRRSNVYLSGRGQFGRFLIREYANRQDHPEDRRCPGDHHRPVQHAERGRAADGGRASRRERRSGLPAAGGGDPLAGRERAVRCRRPGAADPGQRGRPAGQPVLPRAVPGRRRDPGRAARQGAHRPGPAR